VEGWKIVSEAAGKGFRFLMGPDLYEVEMSGDAATWRALREKLEKELAHVERFFAEIEARLSNEKFLERASPEVVARERKKHQDTQERLRLLREQLQILSEV
jgi:valyl-tRNA synthetase